MYRDKTQILNNRYLITAFLGKTFFKLLREKEYSSSVKSNIFIQMAFGSIKSA